MLWRAFDRAAVIGVQVRRLTALRGRANGRIPSLIGDILLRSTAARSATAACARYRLRQAVPSSQTHEQYGKLAPL